MGQWCQKKRCPQSLETILAGHFPRWSSLGRQREKRSWPRNTHNVNTIFFNKESPHSFEKSHFYSVMSGHGPRPNLSSTMPTGARATPAPSPGQHRGSTNPTTLWGLSSKRSFPCGRFVLLSAGQKTTRTGNTAEEWNFFLYFDCWTIKRKNWAWLKNISMSVNFLL